MKNNIDSINNFLKNNKYIRNNKIWILINAISSISILIFCIATMVSSNSNQSIIYGFVYAGYLLSAITSIISCILIIINFIFVYKNDFFKKWYFYLPCIMILFEIIVLPIPLNFATQGNFNSGVVWSLLIFSFCVMVLGLILLVLQFSVFCEDNSDLQHIEPKSIDDKSFDSNKQISNNDSFLNESSSNINESKNDDEIIIPDSIIHND